jgi:hypothetical protein
LRKEKGATEIPTFLLFTGLMAILVPIARYNSLCHTGIQTLTGIPFGIMYGMAYTLIIDRKFLSKYDWYNRDKKYIIDGLFARD